MEYFVGTSSDPKYPGIISGPFNHKPKLIGTDLVFTKNADGTFKQVNSCDHANTTCGGHCCSDCGKVLE